MKKLAIYCSLVIILVLFGVSDIHAQTPKIGVFDIQKIMRDSKKIQSYRGTLEKEIGAKRTLLKQKQDAAVVIEERLKRDGDKISVDERKRLQEGLANELKELKRLREDIDMELQKVDRELTQRALKEINDVIKYVAEKEAYSVIFEKAQAGIVYLKDPFDITQKIINAYDAGR